MEEKEAILGAGCFWATQEGFDGYKGCIKTIVGFSGGDEKNTYEEVYTDKTGHTEVVRVVYDPSKITYEKLLNRFFYIHFSTDKGKQRGDIGNRYKSIIFYNTLIEKEIALKIIKKEQKNYKYKTVQTKVEPFKVFYSAEDRHQHYFKKKILSRIIIRFNWFVENWIIKKVMKYMK